MLLKEHLFYRTPPDDSFWRVLYSVLKFGFSPSKKSHFYLPQWKPFKKMMENAVYFILKALFHFKIFKSLSWIFGHVDKMAWLKR